MTRTLSLWCLCCLIQGCGSRAPQEPKSPSPAEPVEVEPASEPEPETKGWSEVEPLSADSKKSPSSRHGTVVVTSDPEHHGNEIHMRFFVNGVRIEGIFLVPGGRSYSFRIPAGVVEFGSDECSAGLSGFDLAPDESIPVFCTLGADGDCCEVRIPVEAEEQPKGKKKSRKKAEAEAEEPSDGE